MGTVESMVGDLLGGEERESKRSRTDEQPTATFADTFTIGSKLGEGAYSVVYKGKKKETGEEVAIKKIDKVELKAHDHEALHEEVTLSLFLSLCN